MTKDELLAELWPGVVVGDGSVQRAVSLARAVLKQGGLGNAIRNYARQGYRFCLDGVSDATDRLAGGDDLSTARMAFEDGDGDAAVAAFRRADDARALEAVDLERLADACQCSGRAVESEPVLERAAAAYSARGDCRGDCLETRRDCRGCCM